jgi:hypothetical protein
LDLFRRICPFGLVVVGSSGLSVSVSVLGYGVSGGGGVLSPHLHTTVTILLFRRWYFF